MKKVTSFTFVALICCSFVFVNNVLAGEKKDSLSVFPTFPGKEMTNAELDSIKVSMHPPLGRGRTALEIMRERILYKPYMPPFGNGVKKR